MLCENIFSNTSDRTYSTQLTKEATESNGVNIQPEGNNKD